MGWWSTVKDALGGGPYPFEGEALIIEPVAEPLVAAPPDPIVEMRLPLIAKVRRDVDRFTLALEQCRKPTQEATDSRKAELTGHLKRAKALLTILQQTGTS